MNQTLINNFLETILRHYIGKTRDEIIFNEVHPMSMYGMLRRHVYFQGSFEDPIIFYCDKPARYDGKILKILYDEKKLLTRDDYIKMINALPEPSFKDTHLMVDEDTINFRYQ